jgi:DNA-binding response OmpR family regulator
MSGYTGEALATRGGVPADADVIAKPFSGDELLARVRATLDARAR